MSRTISTSINGLTLSLTDPLASGGSDTPLIITSTGAVTEPVGFVPTIYGPASTEWIIRNHGTVSSFGLPSVYLEGAGVLDNFGAISGIQILGDGVITNHIGGSISGGGIFTVDIGGSGVVKNQGAINGGILISGYGVVSNRASIRGAAFRDSIAIEMTGGGVVSNYKKGTILSSGPGYGVKITGGAGEVYNQGKIDAGTGVTLGDGGSVRNGAYGSIVGGVEITGGGGTVANQGAITGDGGIDVSGTFGVKLTAGGAVSNGGTITGINDGLFYASGDGGFGVGISGGKGTVSNYGAITGYGYGVGLTDGGVVTNTAGASITGKRFFNTSDGVAITGGSGTVVNAGTITGETDSVLFGSGTTNDLLVIDPGAVFNGTVDSTGATNSTIELAKGTGAISGIGDGQFLGFDKLVVDTKANWKVSGPNTIGTVLNDGTLGVSGSLDVSTAIDPHSAGVFQLDDTSKLEVAAALGIDWKMSFATGSELVIDNVSMFGKNVGTGQYAGPLLEDFTGATIDIKDFFTTGIVTDFSKATGLLQVTNSAHQKATLDFQSSSLGIGKFLLHNDGSGGVLITHVASSLRSLG